MKSILFLSKNDMANDYQARYIKHQSRKRDQLTNSASMPKANPSSAPAFFVNESMRILKSRRSQRVFIPHPDGHVLNNTALNLLFEAANVAPSSCNRHGIRIRIVHERHQKEILGGLLVGGVGWVHRADTVFLFLADPVAYVSPNEKEFMHYCDVGFTAMSMWLMAESMGLGACYVNPNLTDSKMFYDRFGSIDGHNGIFCGALAVGMPGVKLEEAEHPSGFELECP